MAPRGRLAAVSGAWLVFEDEAGFSMTPPQPRGESDDSQDEDTRQMNLVRAEDARIDEFLDLGDGHPAGHGGRRVEVARGLVEDEVAVAVTASGTDEGEVAGDGFLQDMVAAVEGTGRSLAGEAMATEPSGWWRQGMPPSARGVPTPAGV
ncbi:hypothetical protein ADL04_26540 [Streptomyces sp. NRRL B-3648]|nr:hypothetical protein ADL04_26540 [Streptomyces sp. NRRL B-3648]